MSFRGGPRGRGGSFSGGRGSSVPRGGTSAIGPKRCKHRIIILGYTGRGGYQQSYGPPAAVLGACFHVNYDS